MMLANDHYGLRVNKLFEKISKIQSSIDVDKQSKFRDCLGKLNTLENSIAQAYQGRSNNISDLSQNISILQDGFQLIFESRSSSERKFEQEIEKLEKNIKKLMENFQIERLESEKKLKTRIYQQIDSLSQDVQSHLSSLSSPFFDSYLSELLPELKNEIENETMLRKEVQNKIAQQFLEQIKELKILGEQEKSEREQKEEELVQALKEISVRIGGEVERTKRERGENEENLLRLIEAVVEKMKVEILEAGL